MSKIDLGIDFDAVRRRIEEKMRRYRPNEWAKKVKVAKNIISNVHGAVQQKPSLEYIVAVSMATLIPVEYYLWGIESTAEKIGEDQEVAEVLEMARRVLKSGNSVAVDTLERNIHYFNQAIVTEKRLEKIEEKLDYLLKATQEKSENIDDKNEDTAERKSG